MYTIRVVTNETAILDKRQRKNKMNPNTPVAEPLRPQATLFDLDTMEEVLLYKEVEFSDVTTSEEALARLGNDTAKLLEVINRGLRSEIASEAKKNPSIPWMQEDEKGNLVPFSGTLVNAKDVNTFALNMAKSIFGYSKEMPIEKRREAKQNALNVIKNTEVIRENFKKQATANAGE